jgi:hypothetical protein
MSDSALLDKYEGWDSQANAGYETCSHYRMQKQVKLRRDAQALMEAIKLRGYGSVREFLDIVKGGENESGGTDTDAAQTTPHQDS